MKRSRLFPHSQAIAGRKLFKAFLKLRSVCCGAGLSIIGENLLAAELLGQGTRNKKIDI
jgi:hypothetical protein